ncbi:MAG: beta-N-acetylhexosaminidase [Ignavibacteriales bacterium]|nr:beta-N-acetylhexosaminidase [Ignavibacteriales bacterium]
MKNLILILILTFVNINNFIFSQNINIIPLPVNLELAEGNFVINDITTIYIEKNEEIYLRTAEHLKDNIFKRTGINLKISVNSNKPGIQIFIDSLNVKETDGYSIEIKKDIIKVIANNSNGAFYAVQTLKMLLKKNDNIYFQCCKIYDFPRYAYRGFMLDSSRHFQSVNFIKRILEIMSVLKLNIFHWHLSDDEGWRIESIKYPKLNRIGSYQDSLNSKERNGYYKIFEIKEIIEYAEKLHIKIIPEIEMPGHSRAIMKSFPELLCKTNEGGNTFCAGNEKSYEFIKNLIGEVLDIFHPEIIHVGGDERPKGIWEKCPDCNVMIQKTKLENEDMLQNYFMKEICDYITTKGVKTFAWAENIKEGVPANQIIEGWHPGDSWEAANNDQFTVNADNWFVYFDYPSYPRNDKPNWMLVLNLEKVYSFDPTPDSLDESKHKYILGSECALWTELVLENDVQYQLFPRILALSEVVWSKPHKDYRYFLNRVIHLKSYFDYYGFEYEKGAW